MTEQILGYVIVDRETGDIDWDGRVHESIDSALTSLRSGMYVCTEADENDEIRRYLARNYRICPVLDRTA